jgi:Na+-driven multidrug efflux pump
MMLSNILQSLFGTINNIYLGQMIGVDALAAVSVFFPVLFFFIAFIMGLVLRRVIPTAVRMVVMSLAELVLLGLVNAFGSDATAAYGALNQVMGYVQFPAMSIAISTSIFGAQAIGSGNADRLGAIVCTGLVLNLVLTGGLVALIYLFSRSVMGFFITDAAVLDLAQGLLHVDLTGNRSRITVL